MTGKNTFCTKSDQIGTFHQPTGNPKMFFQCSRIPSTETSLGCFKKPTENVSTISLENWKVNKKKPGNYES